MLLPGSVPADGVRCNTIVKHYADGRTSIMVADRNIFRIPGYEATHVSHKRDALVLPPDPETAYAVDEYKGILADGGLTPMEQEKARASFARAQRRARTQVRDLALANPFRYFVTLTFDRTRVDRWDDTEVMRVTRNWLDNTVRRYGLAYVLVPERHKDGAIHFHGFFNGAVEGIDSGHRTERGQVIYNLPAWPWGFTTAIEVYGEYGAAVSYVCKYITKGTDKVGGRWYYHGGALKKPAVEYLNTDYAALSEGQEAYSIEALGAEMVTIMTDREE